MSIIMSIWKFIVSIFQAIFSHLFAWRYDRLEESVTITQKRRELIDTLPRNTRVLELGAGTGANLTAGAYEGSAGRFQSLTLVEPDNGMRSRLKSKLPGHATALSAGHVSVVSAALPKLPFPDSSFDAVIVYFVLSHVKKRRESLKEITRILAPSGRLLFIDHPAHDHDHDHGDIGHGTAHDSEMDDTTETETTTDQSSQSLRHRRQTAEHEESTTEQNNDNHNGNHHGEKKRQSFFWEIIRWHRMKEHDWSKLSLDALLDDFRNEPLLEELFERRIAVDDFFKEMTYGCFVRKPDPDT